MNLSLYEDIGRVHEQFNEFRRVLLIGPEFDPSFEFSSVIFNSSFLFSRKKEKQYPPLTIFIDGGIELKESFLKAVKEEGFPDPPTLCLGDADSAGKGQKDQFDYLFPEEKNQSDLALGLKFIPPKAQTIELWGFIGGRLDHQMMVLGELSSWLENSFDTKNNIKGRIKDLHSSRVQHEMAFVSAGKLTIDHKGTFSVLSIAPNEIQIEGDCDYPLKQSTIVGALSSLGLSNRANGKVTLKTSAPAFIYLHYDENS